VGCFIIDRDPFPTLKVALNQNGLSGHLQRTGLRVYMIQMFGNPMMI
jgi:hypothetical protein